MTTLTSLLQNMSKKDTQLIEDSLERSYLIADYHTALKRGTDLPKEPFPDIVKALVSERVARAYFEKANFGIKTGLKLASSILTEVEVVETWLTLQKQKK